MTEPHDPSEPNSDAPAPPTDADDAVAAMSDEEAQAALERLQRVAIERYVITATWGELWANPLFRRMIGVRRLGHLLRHPFLRPIVLGPVIAYLIDRFVAPQIPGFTLWGAFAISFLIFFCALGLQRLHCHQAMMSLRDEGTLAHLLGSGMPAREVILSLIHPYYMGDRLGMISIMSYYAVTAGDTFGRNLLLAFVILAAWGLLAAPALAGPYLEQYFRPKSLAAVWLIMLRTGVPLLLWFGLLFGTLFFVYIPLRRAGHTLGSAETDFIVMILAVLFVHRFIAQRWSMFEFRRFITRGQSIPRMLEEFMHA